MQGEGFLLQLSRLGADVLLQTRMSQYLKPQFLKFLAANPGFQASAAIQRMEWRDHHGKLASAQNVGRRLRELVNEGKLLVKYRKNHAYYSIAEASQAPGR